MEYTRLNESDEYRKRREELRLAEMELIAHRERVAEMRRELPAGAVVDDYVFVAGPDDPDDLDAGDGPARQVRLSELFTAPGGQQSAISVFARDRDGSIRHAYSARPERSEDLRERGIDALCATWNLLDLTPTGRGDWYAQLTY